MHYNIKCPYNDEGLKVSQNVLNEEDTNEQHTKKLQKLFKFMASVRRRIYCMNGKQLLKACSHLIKLIHCKLKSTYIAIPKTFNLYLQFDLLWTSKFTENLSSFVTQLS